MEAQFAALDIAALFRLPFGDSVMNSQAVAALGITAISTISAIMLKIWLNHVERMKGMTAPKQDLRASDARLERLEHAMESIAIEIERVSEGQRFVTKLMSEKATAILANSGAKVPVQPKQLDTPH
jgi:hypothetical protein